MNSLKNKILKCKRCNLYKTCISPISHRGNTKAKTMIIGEAPGAVEDQQNKPFVGRSGGVLDLALNLANIKQEDVFITNIVKCRPPKNRNPKREEIKKCSKHLKQQIKILKPKYIITLGNFATQYLLNTKEPITKLRGQFIKQEDYIVMPVFHPAATIYAQNKKETFFTDFEKINKYIKGEDNEKN